MAVLTSAHLQLRLLRVSFHQQLFDFYTFSSEESSDSELEYSTLGIRGYRSSYAERAEGVKRSLRLSHLNNKEKDYVLRWANDYADIFHLSGERLSSTHLIHHRIPRIDKEVIAEKLYRYSHDATDQVVLQTERQCNSGIILSIWMTLLFIQKP